MDPHGCPGALHFTDSRSGQFLERSEVVWWEHAGERWRFELFLWRPIPCCMMPVTCPNVVADEFLAHAGFTPLWDHLVGEGGGPASRTVRLQGAGTPPTLPAWLNHRW